MRWQATRRWHEPPLSQCKRFVLNADACRERELRPDAPHNEPEYDDEAEWQGKEARHA